MIDRGPLYHGPGTPLEPAVAVGGYALAVSCFFSIGLFVGSGQGPATLAQVIALAGVPVLLVRLHGGHRADLGLVAPPLLGVVGAIVAGVGTWLVAWRLALPVVRATDAEQDMRDLTETLLAGEVALVFVTRALVPAICEEVLHRGLLLGALAPRYGRPLAIAAASLVFALLHLEPARMVSAGVVGVLAGLFATWGRSIGPAIALHLVNNAVALALGLGLWPTVAGAIARHPDPALALAASLVGIGLSLAWIGRQRS